MGRVIGIVHRRKQTVAGEARPTVVALYGKKDKVVTIELADDTAELDFVLGRLPFKYRDVEPTEDLSVFQSHHIKWTKAKESELEFSNPAHRCVIDKENFIASKVPAAFTGLKSGDTVAMCMGGSGDRLAYAASKQTGVIVVRIPPFVLSDKRGQANKDDDATLLLTLATNQPDLFRQINARDQTLITLTELYRARIETMKARIGCEQRLSQRLVGQIFFSEEGGYGEGAIEDRFDALKASDTILANLIAEEKRAERALTKAVEAFEVYQTLFEPIEGCGPMIAARLIVATGDIRKFATEAKFRAYCGVHVAPDGTFIRKRAGEVSNWKSEARQALFLIGDQFNRRPDSVWGQKLREVKAELRRKHPEVVMRESKSGKGKQVKVYTDGHIHKMAIWRTITLFANHIYKEWWALEGGKPKQQPVPDTSDTSEVKPTEPLADAA